MKSFSVILIILIVSIRCFTQNTSNQYGFWNQKSLSGAVTLKGHYRDQQRILKSGISDDIQGTLFSGGILLESRSFLVHPNLLALDIDAEYNPEKMDEQFLSIPDRSEVRTLKRLNVNTTFFQEKEVTLNAFINLNQNYINRENLTNSRTNRMFWGGGMFYKNKALPFSVNYQEGKWDQQEIETGRTYNYWQRNINSRITKSFTRGDKNELNFTHDEYISKEAGALVRNNTINYAELRSDLSFDKKKNYNFNTIFSNLNQKGSEELNRFQVFGNLQCKLPKNFKFFADYNFFNNHDRLYTLNQNRAKFDLEHKLFLSLRTNLFFEYSNQNHTLYNENDYKTGINLNYTKKIPTGQLSFSYQFYNRNFSRNSDPVALQVINEEHVMIDGQIILLNKPDVEQQTVVVKDETGTIIYQINLDYVLIKRNEYIEIQRIPGGQIANNGKVLIDYLTLMPGSYRYTLNNQTISVSVLLFNQYLELYYRRSRQDYNNLQQAEYLALNYYLQNLVGGSFNVDFATLGIEYDNYESNIIPYRLIRYYANIHWDYRNKFLLSLVGNINQYKMIADRTNEIYEDISGRFAYSFKPEMKLNLELGYRKQIGYEINLNLLTARTEFTMIIRQIYLTAGLEVYRRYYLDNETINFNGAYVSIVRKF